jgi:hypothetical protein
MSYPFYDHEVAESERDHQPLSQRMWPGGPLRQFSKHQASSHYVAYSSPILKGYTGSYVCDRCQTPSPGVYFVKPVGNWLCGPCKRMVERDDAGRQPVTLAKRPEAELGQDVRR